LFIDLSLFAIRVLPISCNPIRATLFVELFSLNPINPLELVDLCLFAIGRFAFLNNSFLTSLLSQTGFLDIVELSPLSDLLGLSLSFLALVCNSFLFPLLRELLLALGIGLPLFVDFFLFPLFSHVLPSAIYSDESRRYWIEVQAEISGRPGKVANINESDATRFA
jgi:hypothetical protein